MSAVQQPRRWQSRDPGAQGSRQQRIARINPQVWTRMICGPRLGTFCREPPPHPGGSTVTPALPARGQMPALRNHPPPQGWTSKGLESPAPQRV